MHPQIGSRRMETAAVTRALNLIGVASFGNFPVFRLLDTHEAPWPLFYRFREVVQIVGHHPEVLDGVGGVLSVRPYQGLHIGDQSASFRDRFLQLDQVSLSRFTERCDRLVCVRYG